MLSTLPPPRSRRSFASPWDRRVASRALAFAFLALLLAVVITALTDEGAVPLSTRIARALPTAPACGAAGTWLALRGARLRGELLALEAAGRSPWQNALAAALGGAVAVVLAATAIGSVRAVDVSGFFPRASRAEDFAYLDGAFVDARRGFRVTAEGDVERLDASGPPTGDTLAAIPPRGRTAAALALVIAGVALALLVARGRASLIDGAALALSVLAAIALFHGAAAGRIEALAAVVPSALLLGWVLFRYRARHG